ncbi:Insulinase (Peptidase M16) [Tulasnella sp. JGI-2019a]|nr:Insulinase (Peptidase M16) [Tulasnella sp. JGI-2019a]KAG9039404.1 Insulinase (Peptidase M16) [Tulasnella sp. JGI-2019a]
MHTDDTTNWATVNDASGKKCYDVFTKPLEKGRLDDREYRYIKLPNALEALLISDPKADKAAAALDVEVGHLSDPDDVPGCAHFCEHLLFMGTKDFPSENEYSQFISTHGGSTNAFTSAFNTNYHFTVNPSQLDPALHRFSTFFISPLFSESCTNRELNAVDSEHKKNKQNDMWRMFQLSKTLSRADHPWRKFGSGNRESLLAAGRKVAAAQGFETPGTGAVTPNVEKTETGQSTNSQGTLLASSIQSKSQADDGGPAGRETRRRLVEWWEGQYCASRMKLVVLGKESVDELSQMAVKLFSAVPNRSLPAPPMFDSSPLGEEHRGIIAYAKTVMDFSAIEMNWCIPWQTPEWRVKPASFVTHFLGHEGPGSLHSYLKNKGWITYLSAGPSTGGPGFDWMKCTIVLTPEGFENHLKVIRVVYSYLSLLRGEAFPSWHQQEIIQLSKINFEYKEKQSPSSYVSRTAEKAARLYPREKLLSASSVTEEWDEAPVRELLAKYLTIKDGRIIVMGREGWDKITLIGEEGGTKEERAWQKEKYYGTEYLTRRLPQHIIQEGEGPNLIKELTLPGPNAFVPANLEVEKKHVDEPLKRPLKIRSSSMSSLWYKKDDQFWVPKAHVQLQITSPVTTVTPKHNVSTRLYTDLVRDALTEYSYDADLAGLSYDVSNTGEGIHISVGGYNDKLIALLKVVLDKLKTLTVNQERFEVLKEQLRQEYENLLMEQPYTLSDYFTRYLLSPTAWTPQEKLTELALLKQEDVQKHIPEFLSRVHIEAFVHGNAGKDEANEILRITEGVLAARTLTPTELLTDRSLLLPPACNYVLELPVSNKDDVNSALTYYLQVGDVVDAPLRARLGLLAHIASEPAFNQLRTNEQLGYVVSSGTWSASGSLGWRVVVQSEKNPTFLENRVDVFFDETLKKLLQTMSEEEFGQKRQGLIDKKLEKYKNLGEETSSFWNHINNGYHDFMRRSIDAENLKSVSRQEVLDLFMEKIHPASKSRSKLSLHLRSQTAPSPKFTVAASVALLNALKLRGVAVQEEDYHRLSAAEPPLSAVKAFWTNHFKSLSDLSKSNVEDLLKTMDRVAKENPAPNSAEDGNGKLADDVVYVHEMSTFKAGLAMSRAATPIVLYNDVDARL